jgi:organic hydroperoxide reductase OsmC/OhrA
MSDRLQYSVNASWIDGERASIAAKGVEEPEIEFAAPVDFHGEEGFWTPEHFLLAAVASCFTTTFRAIAGNSKLDVASLEIHVEGTLSKNPAGWDFTSVVIRPKLTIHNEEDRSRACRILEKTERGCLIARALKCGVEMHASVDSLAAVAECEAVGVT